MGFRVQQARELDPQMRFQEQQVSPGNPYFSQMMQQDEASHNRQLQLRQQEGTAQGNLAAANIAKRAAWTQGLDGLSKAFLPAAQTVQGMRLSSRQQDENEKTGEVNRTSAMENALRTRQQRELDATYAPQERQGGIDATKANIGLTGVQTSGMQTANDSAKIAFQSQQAKQLFEQADASQYGFQNAKPGESVSQYTMRMDAEGKIADVQRVKAESAKMQQEMQFMPERLRLEKMQTLASIEASRASAANARVMGQVAVAGSNRDQQSHELNIHTQKMGLVEKEIDEVMKGLSSGTLMGKQLSPQESAQILQKKIQDIGGRYGVNMDTDAAISRAIGKNSSDSKAAQIADIANANLDPARRTVIEKNVSQMKLAMAGQELLKNLESKVKQYEGAGAIWNSEKSNLAASEIQSTLDSAAIQEPRFKPYADKFREINSGVWAGGVAGIRNVFGDSPQKQAKVLLKSIANTIATELNATKFSDPITANALQAAQNQMKTTTNVFSQLGAEQQFNPMAAPQGVPAMAPQQTQPQAGFQGRR